MAKKRTEKKTKTFSEAIGLHETDDETGNALRKLHKKNLDLIVLNSLKDSNACFGYDTNKVTIIDRNEVQWQYELKSKKEVAHDIVDRIVQLG